LASLEYANLKAWFASHSGTLKGNKKLRPQDSLDSLERLKDMAGDGTWDTSTLSGFYVALFKRGFPPLRGEQVAAEVGSQAYTNNPDGVCFLRVGAESGGDNVRSNSGVFSARMLWRTISSNSSLLQSDPVEGSSIESKLESVEIPLDSSVLRNSWQTTTVTTMRCSKFDLGRLEAQIPADELLHVLPIPFGNFPDQEDDTLGIISRWNNTNGPNRVGVFENLVFGRNSPPLPRRYPTRVGGNNSGLSQMAHENSIFGEYGLGGGRVIGVLQATPLKVYWQSLYKSGSGAKHQIEACDMCQGLGGFEDICNRGQGFRMSQQQKLHLYRLGPTSLVQCSAPTPLEADYSSNLTIMTMASALDQRWQNLKR